MNTVRVPTTGKAATPALAWPAAISGALCIAAAAGLLPSWLAFLFKPLTTVLIIVYAWHRGRDTPLQRRCVLAGLLLSLAGDVFLLWPTEGFLFGLVSFLLAHLLYIAAYVAFLATMAAQAAVWWRTAPSGSAARSLAARAASGGALFMMSDTLLAFNKFAQPLLLAPLWILTTYWVAQWCIASAMAPVTLTRPE